MMKYEDFSDLQKNCIDVRDKSVLVSAAAGSGKTAVLVERIYQLLISGVSISDMLIVTYTNAAASEMKEKIREKIYESSIKETDSLKKKQLRKEYSLVEEANISTFHSFYLDVIKNFFYVNSYEPNLKFGDELQLESIYDEALEELVSNYFEENNEEFLFYIDQYCRAGDYSNFKKTVSGIYNKVITYREGINFLYKAKDLVVEYINDFKSSTIFNALDFSREKEQIENILKQLDGLEIEVSGNEAYKKSIGYNRELVQGYLDSLLTLNYKKGRWNSPTNKNDYNEEYSLKMAEIKKDYDAVVSTLDDILPFLSDVDSLKYLIECETNIPTYKEKGKCKYHIFDFLIDSVKKFEELVNKKEKAAGIISFNDSERMAYDLLGKEEPNRYYQGKFKYIFVDEYQDESDIQNAIIDRLSNGTIINKNGIIYEEKNSSNLFLVGDIKQSIYRFRNSEPELFLDRIKEFSDGKNNKCEVMSLNENYRSKAKIVDFVNNIFRVTMKEEYSKENKLVAKCDDKDTDYSDAKLYIFEREELDELDGDIEDLKNIEFEAKYIAKIIKEHLGKPYLDGRKGEKKLDYKDMVILLRTVKGKGDILYKILKEEGIPSYVTNDEGYYDSIEISSFVNVLKIIDNYKQDVELLSALRTGIFGFTFDDFADIRINEKKVEFSKAFFDYLETGANEELKNKISCAISKIEKYKKLSRLIPIDELLWQIMLDEGFYLEMGALVDGERRQANLRTFVDLARNYRVNYDNSLAGFIKYTGLNIDKQLNSAQAKIKSENDNVVRIMSIHKSKGLEYPLVIIPDAAKYKDNNASEKIEINRKLGIGLDVQDRNRLLKKKTAITRIIERINKDEELKEKKHLLYVGLTRAKDYLYVIGSVKNVDKINKNSFLGMMYGNVDDDTIINPEFIEKNDQIENAEASSNNLEYIKKIKEDTSYDSNFDYEYKYRKDEKVHSKYSVSELNQANKEETKTQYKIRVEKKESNYTAAEIGNIVHKFLEKMDFRLAKEKGESYLEELKKDLVSREILLADEIKEINNELVMKYVDNDIFSRAINSKELYKEKEFIMNYDIDGVTTLCQGIIDCFFIEDDNRAVLIDYKSTRNKDKEQVKRDYEKQIEIYKEAIKLGKNIEVKEAYLYLTNFGELIEM